MIFHSHNSYQFEVVRGNEDSMVVIDTRSGRPMTGNLDREAAIEKCSDLNDAAAKGASDLARTLAAA